MESQQGVDSCVVRQWAYVHQTRPKFSASASLTSDGCSQNVFLFSFNLVSLFFLSDKVR